MALTALSMLSVSMKAKHGYSVVNAHKGSCRFTGTEIQATDGDYVAQKYNC